MTVDDVATMSDVAAWATVMAVAILAPVAVGLAVYYVSAELSIWSWAALVDPTTARCGCGHLASDHGRWCEHCTVRLGEVTFCTESCTRSRGEVVRSALRSRVRAHQRRHRPDARVRFGE